MNSSEHIKIPQNPKKRDTTFCRVSLFLERAMGVEPTSKAWEAFILPMNYARIEQ